MKQIKRLLSSLLAGLIIGIILYLFNAPLWACIGFAWLGADNSVIYQILYFGK